MSNPDYFVREHDPVEDYVDKTGVSYELARERLGVAETAGSLVVNEAFADPLEDGEL